MVADCQRAASIGARQIRRRVVARSIHIRADEKTTYHDYLSRLTKENQLRLLLVVGVLLILAIVLYRVLRPVINLARTFVKTVRHFQQVTSRPARANGAAEKLIKCEACETWIPESRKLMAGSLAYCSRDCLKRPGVNRRTDTAA